jgi:hypothetical protein
LQQGHASGSKASGDVAEIRTTDEVLGVDDGIKAGNEDG